MSQVKFYREYNPIAERVLRYQRDYREMSTADRAIGAIKNEQDMNKVFADKIKDESLGHRVDVLA